MYEAVIRFEERISRNGKPYTCVVATIINGGQKVDVLLGYQDCAQRIALELLK